MYFTISAFIAVSAATSVVSAISGEGRATFYGDPTDEAKGEYNPFSKKMLGACGPKRDEAPIGVEKFYVAMNGKTFDSYTPMASYGPNSYGNTLCGTCLRVTNPDNGKQTVVFLTDSCPSCPDGAIDLSLSAMSQLVGSSEQAYHQGIIKNAAWETVKCPASLLPTDSAVKPATEEVNYVQTESASKPASEVKAAPYPATEVNPIYGYAVSEPKSYEKTKCTASKPRVARLCPNDSKVLTVVKDGDSLWDIAKEHDHDFQAILESNAHLGPEFDLIYAKDEVCIPEGCAKFSGPDENPYVEEKVEFIKSKPAEAVENDDELVSFSQPLDSTGLESTSGARSLTVALLVLLVAFLI
jgi:LysM repeat protein